MEEDSRWRQRVKHLDGLKMWLQKESTVLIHSVRGRKQYRETMANLPHGRTLEEEADEGSLLTVSVLWSQKTVGRSMYQYGNHNRC